MPRKKGVGGKRMHFIASPEVLDDLSKIKTNGGYSTDTNAIARSVRFFAIVLEEQKNGYELVLRKPDSKESTILVIS